jgi:Disintegrin
LRQAERWNSRNVQSGISVRHRIFVFLSVLLLNPLPGSLMQGTAQSSLNTSCLSNPDPSRQTITLQMCGNGIVENGEDCDPGKGTNSTCCDSSTCKFLGGAVCDPSSSPCCTAQCQFAPATQVCRAAKDPNCDTTEVCTGNSSACPADVFAPNGKSCGPNGLACAAGQCTSMTRERCKKKNLENF